MGKLPDLLLVRRVETWLLSKGCAVSKRYQDGEYHIYYTLKSDVVPQPAVRIHGGLISFPSGSQEDVVLQFLMEQ